MIKNLGDTVDCIRIKKGLSIESLAYKAGVSESTVKNILRKRNNPSLPILIRLTDALGISLCNFFLLASCKEMQPHKEYELLCAFEKLSTEHKQLIIYIASHLE